MLHWFRNSYLSPRVWRSISQLRAGIAKESLLTVNLLYGVCPPLSFSEPVVVWVLNFWTTLFLLVQGFDTELQLTSAQQHLTCILFNDASLWCVCRWANDLHASKFGWLDTSVSHFLISAFYRRYRLALHCIFLIIVSIPFTKQQRAWALSVSFLAYLTNGPVFSWWRCGSYRVMSRLLRLWKDVR